MDKSFSEMGVLFCPTISPLTNRRVTQTHITDVKVGDVVLMQESRRVHHTRETHWVEKTVCRTDIRRGGFCGSVTLFGDSFYGGRHPVPVVDYSPIK